MAAFILLLIILLPIAEITLFIKVGGRFGMWATVGTIFLTALIGTALLRQQGLATLAKVQKSLEQNHFPIAEVFNGLCLLIAGALLLIPGFITDTIGLLLFIPIVRKLLQQIFLQYLTTSGRINIKTNDNFTQNNNTTIIDGEYHEVHCADKSTTSDDDDLYHR